MNTEDQVQWLNTDAMTSVFEKKIKED